MAATESLPQFGDLPRSEQRPAPPFAPRATTSARALAEPHISCLTINVKPEAENQLLELMALGIREELLHGERKRFGLTRNVHLLQRRAISHLVDYLQSDEEALEAAEAITEHYLAAHRLAKVQRGFLEAVDQYLKNRALGQEGTFDGYAEAFAERHDVDPAAIRDDLEGWRATLETERTEARYQDVYDDLDAVGESYSPSVAQHVADAALDIPYAVAPAEVPNTVTRPLADSTASAKERLQRRLDRAIEAVHQMDDPADEGPGLRRTLETDLHEVDEWAATAAAEGDSVADISIPLLDEPMRVADVETQPEAGGPRSPMDQIIGAAFGLPGNFGGIVYWDERQEPRWLVNPLVDDTYRQRWEAAYVGNRLLEQVKWNIWRRDGDPTDYDAESTVVETHCPLCQLSRAETEHHPRCTYATMIETLNDDIEAFLDRFRMVDSYETLVDTLRSEYEVSS